MDGADGGQQLDPRHLGHPLVGEHHGDRAIRVLHLAQPEPRGAGAAQPDDVVVTAVALPELVLDIVQRCFLVVDGEDERTPHG